VGAGKNKAHQPFQVSPTTKTEPIAQGQEPSPQPPTPSVALAAASALPGAAGSDQDMADQYTSFCGQVAQAQDLIEQAAADEAPEVVGEAKQQLRVATSTWLGSLDEDQLQALAAGTGFQHPSLVGLNAKPGEPGALAHWLDPAFPHHSMSKAKIQAKAIERYDELLAGGTVAGKTLADVTVAEAALAAPSSPPEGWLATPGQLDQLQAHLEESVTKALHGHVDDRPAALFEAISTENLLTDAYCPQLSAEEQAARKAATKAPLDGLAHLNVPYLFRHPEPPLDISKARFVNSTEGMALLRHSTPLEVREAIEAKALGREADFEALKGARAALAPAIGGGTDGGLAVAPLSEPGGLGEAVAFTVAAGQWSKPYTAAQGWWFQAAGRSSLGGQLKDEPPAPWDHAMPGPHPSELTTRFRTWAKVQPLGQLKAVAHKLGVKGPGLSGATRAQVQNSVISHWDADVPAPDLSAPKAKPAPKAVAPAVTPPGPSTAPSGPKAGHGAPLLSKFSSMKLALKEKLAHHVASVSALPGWHGRGTVEAMQLTPASAVPVGGVHSKGFYSDPEANMWMFKPDKAVRAHSEAAASELLQKAGIPSVPVYPRPVGGKTGSIQRFLAQTKPLEPHVSSWSQADVDAMVRYHVGAWAIGDHDAKPDNILRTPGGGLVPIDHGQAFKFYGHDKLDTTYHPNGQFGAGRPVYNQAYEAAKKGSLAPGVRVRPEAALPVIAALEAVPDTQYRALLHETAYQGAKQKVSWYDAMRSRAAKVHSDLSPSDTQVADAFLDYACERKNRLRADFAEFFTREGFSHEALAAQLA
jgi:hypothetical protein